MDNEKKLKVGKKRRIFHKKGNIKKKELSKLDLYVENSQKCDCGLPKPGNENSQYFVMGEKKGNKFYVKGIHLYDKTNKELKKALRAIRNKGEICQKKGMEMLLVNDDPYINGLDKPKKNSGKSNKKASKKAGGNKRNGDAESRNSPTVNGDVSGVTGMTTLSEQQSKTANKGAGRKSNNKKSKKGRSRDNANRRRQAGNKKSRTRDSVPQAT